MNFRKACQLLVLIIMSSFTVSSLSAQAEIGSTGTTLVDADFDDRAAVHTAIKNFFIGDHTGSVKHKKLSMHEKGAYRYVTRDGKYGDGVFSFKEGDSDQTYTEELLDVEIYGNMALVKCRLNRDNAPLPSYKLFTLHKFEVGWRITTITWGYGITY